MRVVDLTHDIAEGMPVYPGTEGPRIAQATTIERDGFAERLISMYSHTGTHMDAPGHILEGAETLDRFEAGHFIGRAAVVDVSGCAGGLVEPRVLESQAGRLAGLEFVLLRSGWSALWGRRSYFEGFPTLSEEAAELLCGLGLRGVGLDSISADRVDAVGFPVHGILFGAGLVIVENLACLEALGDRAFTFSCLPLKMPSSDGSPVRAVAIVDDEAG